MTTATILKEIAALPTADRLTIIEKTITMIRNESSVLEKKKQLKKAAKLLRKDYLKDKELTAFSSLDTEDFYEAQ
jgi:hypothetical protein